MLNLNTWDGPKMKEGIGKILLTSPALYPDAATKTSVNLPRLLPASRKWNEFRWISSPRCFPDTLPRFLETLFCTIRLVLPPTFVPEPTTSS